MLPGHFFSLSVASVDEGEPNEIYMNQIEKIKDKSIKYADDCHTKFRTRAFIKDYY